MPHAEVHAAAPSMLLRGFSVPCPPVAPPRRRTSRSRPFGLPRVLWALMQQSSAALGRRAGARRRPSWRTMLQWRRLAARRLSSIAASASGRPRRAAFRQVLRLCQTARVIRGVSRASRRFDPDDVAGARVARRQPRAARGGLRGLWAVLLRHRASPHRLDALARW